MSISTSYLKKRKQGWYVQVAVPRELQALLGKSPIMRSLRTRDLVEANRRKHEVIAGILSDFRQASAVAPPPADMSPEGILQSAMRLRDGIDSGHSRLEDAEVAHEVAVDAYLDAQAR